MTKTEICNAAERFGEFYMYFRRFNEAGFTYLVGTLDWNDCPYIQEKAKELSDKMLAAANEPDKILVWSWSSNRFRLFDVERVKRISPLDLKNPA